MQLSVGTVQMLTVLRKIDTGYVLSDGTNDILLHNNEATNELQINESVKVFLYNDRNNQIVATMKIPSIQLETYDWAEVVENIPKLGVFVNIGINKDMLVSVDDLPV